MREIFHETQPMTGMLLVLPIIIGCVIFVIYKMRSVGTIRMAVIFSGLIILIGTIIIAIIATLKLDVYYYSDRIEYQFGSLFSAKYEVVKLDTVAKVKVVSYNPEDYGGWGMKGNADTKVYNTSGNKGIMFTFKSGQHLLIGTQLPDSLYSCLKNDYPF